jgi:hypothetical protein
LTQLSYKILLIQNFRASKLIFSTLTLVTAFASLILFLLLSLPQTSSAAVDNLVRGLTNKTASEIQGLKTYENTSAGINIQFPPFWKANSTYDPDDPGVVTRFDGPKGEYVEIAVDFLGNSTRTLNQDVDNAITFYQNESKDFKLLELNTDATLAGRPAYKLVYTSKDPDTNSSFISMETTAIVGNKAYTISYIADPDKFYVSLPMVQNMVGSFKIRTGVSNLVH